MSAILLASAGVVILLVGGGIGYWAGRSGVGGSKAKLEKAEAELDDYKRSVTEHFGQTAEHFQAIGRQYRELYEHMASGAQSLCESDEAGRQLLFAPDADAAAAAETPVESVAEAQAPVDYAEEPALDEATDVVEAGDAPADEVTVKEETETRAAIEAPVAEVSETEVAEAANDPQSDDTAKVAERTLH